MSLEDLIGFGSWTIEWIVDVLLNACKDIGIIVNTGKTMDMDMYMLFIYLLTTWHYNSWWALAAL